MIFSPDIGEFASASLALAPLSHTLNYGDGIFEGMSIILGKRVSLFHPELNYERMQYGADKLEYNYKIDIVKSINTVFYLFLMNNYKDKGYKRIYVRPVLYFSNESVGLRAERKAKLMHALMPMGEYIEKDGLRVVVSNIKRELPFARLKAISNYQLSLYSLRKEGVGYDEIVFLDKYNKITEGSGENIIFLKDNVLYTDKRSSLPGITLRFIVLLAKELGLKFRFGSFRIDQLKDIDLLMFTGNAIGIKRISEVVYKGQTYKPKEENLELYNEIKQRYNKILYEQDEQYHMFLDEFIDLDEYERGIINIDKKPERFDKVVKDNIDLLGIKKFL